MRVPIDSGTAVTLTSNLSEPESLAVAAFGAFWTSPASPGDVMTVPLAGGTATTVAVSDNPRGIATDGANLYWVGDNSVFALPLVGGSTATLAVSWRLNGLNSGSIAVNPTSVYVGVNNQPIEGAIVRVPIGGGALTILASGQTPESVAVDATNVYWTNWSGTGGSVVRAPLGGGAPTTLAAGPDAFGIAVDGSTVYWTNRIAVDSTSVYWLSEVGVMKLTPK